MTIKIDENGNWKADVRGSIEARQGMAEAVYDRTSTELVEDLNRYLNEAEEAGITNQDFVAYSLFEACGEVLGPNSPEFQQIMRLGASIALFLATQEENGKIEQYDERG